MEKKQPLIVVLDNVRSAYNVGSVIRTADCAGVQEVWTCGYTPTTKHPKVQKTALTAQEHVLCREFRSLEEAIEELLANNYRVLVCETGPSSTSLWDMEVEKAPSALIFGNEVDGVQLDITNRFQLNQVFVPMYGHKESLNISNAVAIIVYDIIKRWV